jgi:aminocarboxymuconate-semialdehyde decarboxylase
MTGVEAAPEEVASRLHGCGPAALERRPKTPRARRADQKVIDLHCHYLDEATELLVQHLPERPAPVSVNTAANRTAAYNRELMQTTYRAPLTSVAVRLADMDAMGVDIQAISPSPTQYYYWATEEASREIVLSQNTHIAEICAAHPDRFVGIGSVSLQHPRTAVEQARYAVKTLGLRGVEVSSIVNGVPIDDKRFDIVWAELESLGAMVLLHPLGTTAGPRLDDHYLSNVIGQPLETEIALLRLIFGGHFDRYQALKICAVHGGGYLPLYVSRSDHAWRVRPESCGCRLKPSEYLRRIWFDTLVYDVAHLRRLIDVVGTDRVVIGTDYPFDMGDYDPVDLVNAVTGLPKEAARAILAGNAGELLGLNSLADD